MAGSKLADGLERQVINVSKAVGRLQIGVNKILWGSGNTQPSTTVQLVPATGSQGTSRLNYVTNTPTAPQTAQQSGIRRFAQSGLFNILNALNSVDLCNVITYAYDNANIKKKPRPQPPYTGSQVQRIFYSTQDACGQVVKYIDKYTAYPNVFITSYIGTGVEGLAPVIGVENNNAPVQGGTAVRKYNTYFLMQSIKETLTFGTGTGSLFTPEDAQTMQAVPGLVSSVNFLRDSVGLINQYSDYRQISDANLQKLIDKIDKIRTVCVTVQNLNFRDPKGLVNLTANYLGVDIRNQIQQLNKYIDVTKIIPTLKQVNNALQSFIRICNQIQKIISIAQFVIKLGILFYKIFKFILKFFTALPIPSIFTTVGIQQTLRDARDKASNEADGVMRILKATNAFLAIAIEFIKYLLANTVELIKRLETLLAVLRACESMKDSDVLFELEETNKQLLAVKEQLETYIIKVEGKTDPNTAEFGAYQIRVEEEQLVETTVSNRRRRGIALDQNGRIVAQSDLTFATDQRIIIEEVKQKLVSLGLINPVLANLDTANLAVISESLNYLDNNDVLDEDLNLTEDEVLTEAGDNLDENQGIGLQAFVNNLKGGRRLRRRMRQQLAKQRQNLAGQIRQTDNTGRFTGTANTLERQAKEDQIKSIEAQIGEWKAEIAVAATQGPAGLLIIRDRIKKIKAAQQKIAQLRRPS